MGADVLIMWYNIQLNYHHQIYPLDIGLSRLAKTLE